MHGCRLQCRFELEEIILQGDVIGPIECSVMLDSFGKESLREISIFIFMKNGTQNALKCM